MGIVRDREFWFDPAFSGSLLDVAALADTVVFAQIDDTAGRLGTGGPCVVFTLRTGATFRLGMRASLEVLRRMQSFQDGGTAKLTIQDFIDKLLNPRGSYSEPKGIGS